MLISTAIFICRPDFRYGRKCGEFHWRRLIRPYCTKPMGMMAFDLITTLAMKSGIADEALRREMPEALRVSRQIYLSSFSQNTFSGNELLWGSPVWRNRSNHRHSDAIEMLYHSITNRPLRPYIGAGARYRASEPRLAYIIENMQLSASSNVSKYPSPLTRLEWRHSSYRCFINNQRVEASSADDEAAPGKHCRAQRRACVARHVTAYCRWANNERYRRLADSTVYDSVTAWCLMSDAAFY